MQVGYKLMAEVHSPREIVRQALRAEDAGFDFVEVSDHIHPWLPSNRHSGFAWSMLAAIAARTEKLQLATGVTCPIMRYHPAIIAQAAATTAILSDGRFTLGLGSGENLNEHVVGRGWPSVSVRHEMLREAVEMIQLLMQPGYHSYTGTHLRCDDTQIFDLPDDPVPVVVAAGGKRAATLAGELADGLFATDPDAELISAFAAAGGSGPLYVEVPLAYASDRDAAVREAHDKFRFSATGWKVQAELPNPINFEAATSSVRESDIEASMPCGADEDAILEQVKKFADAGFDHLTLLNAGPDVDGFLDAAGDGLIDRVRALA